MRLRIRETWLIEHNLTQEIYRVTHKGWDCKDDPKLKNMKILILIFDFCIQWCILMVYWMINRNNLDLDNKELSIQGNGRSKFRTIFSEVSSFVGNPVPGNPTPCTAVQYGGNINTLRQRFVYITSRNCSTHYVMEIFLPALLPLFTRDWCKFLQLFFPINVDPLHLIS